MRVRVGLAVIAAVTLSVLVPVAASAVSGSADVHATLVRIDVFHAGANPNRGPGSATANCTNDGATVPTEWAVTGWKTAGGLAHLNASTVPSSLPGAATALQSAFSVWSTGTNAPQFTVVADGTVSRQTPNRQTDLMFGRVSGSAIAVTYTWKWTDGLVESDTVFNRSLGWGNVADTGDGCNETQPYYDLQNIATHEFGHIYGLDHPADGRFETMYAYGYTGESLKRTPGQGDLAGLATIYP